VEYLLECVGVPPDFPRRELEQRILREGESAPWRGAPEDHLRLALGGGLELRMDRDEDEVHWTLTPHYRDAHRMRLAIDTLRGAPDAPHDALLRGWAFPPTPGEDSRLPGAYRMATWVNDARRLPRRLAAGHVVGVSCTGYALAVDYLGANDGGATKGVLERPHGARLMPLTDAHSPGGAMHISARLRAVHHLRNSLTGNAVDLLEIDAPGRPLHLFTSPWQLREDGFAPPRPGLRIEGVFIFAGRIAGGLPRPAAQVRAVFG
jgi:hypothetical protein